MSGERCKIFIMAQWMNIGGIESSLLGLLKEMDYSSVQIDLCLQHHSGQWLNEIPKKVNLLPYDPKIARVGMGLKAAKESRDWVAWLFVQASRYLAGAYYKIFRRCKVDEIGFNQIGWEIKRWMLPRRIGSGGYDLCLIFGAAPGFSNLVDAKVHAVWVHTDWATYKPIKWLARKQFSRVDYIVNVSNSAKKNFDEVVNLSDKSIVIENVISPTWVQEMAYAFRVDEFDGLKIISVGRVTSPKNYFRALEAAKVLASRSIRFMWLVVGDGEQFDALKEAVDRSGISSSFRLVGPKTNPYPYYKWCDMLVCTSDWEGKSVAVREAQMFAKPVVVTRFPTAASQVEDGVDGLLVERTPGAVADGIERLMNDAELRRKLSSSCRDRDFSNVGEIKKILALCKPDCSK